MQLNYQVHPSLCFISDNCRFLLPPDEGGVSGRIEVGRGCGGAAAVVVGGFVSNLFETGLETGAKEAPVVGFGAGVTTGFFGNVETF